MRWQKGLLPALQEKDILTRQQIIAQEQYTQHPPRYTEASLVKKMEKQSIKVMPCLMILTQASRKSLLTTEIFT